MKFYIKDLKTGRKMPVTNVDSVVGIEAYAKKSDLNAYATTEDLVSATNGISKVFVVKQGVAQNALFDYIDENGYDGIILSLESFTDGSVTYKPISVNIVEVSSEMGLAITNLVFLEGDDDDDDCVTYTPAAIGVFKDGNVVLNGCVNFEGNYIKDGTISLDKLNTALKNYINDRYTVSAADAKFATIENLNKKADKTYTDNTFAKKTDVYTQGEVDSAISTAVSTKVDKVAGMGLSHNDFTDTFKNKLNSLENYDATALTTEINNLKNTINTLIEGGNVTEAIDTFNEIEAFLADFKNTDTLTDLLDDLKNSIEDAASKAYVNLTTNQDINGVKTFKSNIFTEGRFKVKSGGAEKTAVGYDSQSGSILYNAASNKALGIKDNGTPHFDGHELARVDGSVAFGNQVKVKQLTNESLDNIKDGDFTVYYANGSNTVTKKPAGIGPFNLQVVKNADNDRLQIITAPNGDSYKRSFSNSTWSAWKKMLTEDDIAELENKVTTLEAANTTLTNKLNNAIWFGTQAEYDALTTKNEGGLYCIVEE